MDLEVFSTLPSNRVRNFCMLAHVDHGKTTLSDFLLTANGLLSKQLAGKVRFLDSRPDEQERLITMKASCVALRHVVDGEEQLVHLVDSPGHIDFSSEVSTAMRMCDGALVVVDVIDGITIQTKAMLRQAFSEGLRMVLVINKLDLLISTLQLTPEEAYQRLEKIIQDCNVVLSAYVNVLTIAGTHPHLLEVMQVPEDERWFNPQKGNVVFASGMDGYGFSLESMAKTWVATGKLGSITAEELQQALWGESYLDVKTMTILPRPKKEGQPPMAVTFVFEPIWGIHTAFKDEESFDEGKVAKITSRLGVSDKVWKNQAKRALKDKMSAILSAWLPLAECLLDAVCHHLPSIVDGQRSRLVTMMPQLGNAAPVTREALLTADPAGPVVAYVGKLIDTEYLAGTCQYGDREKSIEDCFIGFARVFSGTLTLGLEVKVISGGKTSTTKIGQLFLLRGQGLEPVERVPPGRLCGISGMMPFITKHGVMTTDEALPEFNPPKLSSTSIVHYVLRPKQPANFAKLLNGLKLLYQTDPQVELAVLPSGEYVLGVAGEVHGERCVEDLNTTFARVEFHISPPIVQYREALVTKSLKLREVDAVTPCGGFSCSIAALPFPEEVVDAMCVASNSATDVFIEQTLRVLAECKEAKKRPWDQALKTKVLGTAPSKYNFFGCALYDISAARNAEVVPGATVSGDASPESTLSAATSVTGDESDQNRLRALTHFREAIVSGFQLAAGAGVMAEEPMFGTAFFVTRLEVKAAAVADAQAIAMLTRNVLSTVGNACRQAMQLHTNGMRIVEPIYECVVHSAGATQGKVYNILNRRRAEIDEEVMAEGGETYYIVSHLPVGESFGLQDELRIATSGAATAILRMDKWKIIDQDPYFRPTTKEEIEEYGTDGVIPNFAATLIESVRSRKGIQKRNLVENAEKQKFSMRGA